MSWRWETETKEWIAGRRRNVNRSRECPVLVLHDGTRYSGEQLQNLRKFAKRYGATPEDYAALYEKQDGKCAICREPETRVVYGSVARLCIDHCHKSDVVRGLLCSLCNTAIGKFGDDVWKLHQAIRYLY